MNKVLAEIIAGTIPHKMTRNRWRGLLRYGVFNVARLKRRIKENTTTPQNYLTICSIAKNEGPYVKEWLDWHINKGVEKFYFYDNESTDNTREVLEPYIRSGVVDYKYWPGRCQQLPAYDDCMENHRFDSRWIAVIDLDEFIIPVRDGSIPAFLKTMEDFSVVELNWMCYGSGGQKEKTPGSVMERFKYHAKPDYIKNRHVKSIVDPRRVCVMIGCHEAARIRGYAGDSHGRRIRKNFRDREPQYDVIHINHYAVKSYEEFLLKKARGRARTLAQRQMDYFLEYDRNEIKDEFPDSAQG